MAFDNKNEIYFSKDGKELKLISRTLNPSNRKATWSIYSVTLAKGKKQLCYHDYKNYNSKQEVLDSLAN